MVIQKNPRLQSEVGKTFIYPKKLWKDQNVLKIEVKVIGMDLYAGSYLIRNKKGQRFYCEPRSMNGEYGFGIFLTKQKANQFTIKEAYFLKQEALTKKNLKKLELEEYASTFIKESKKWGIVSPFFSINITVKK